MADINGDGHPDVRFGDTAEGSGADSNLSVLLGDGAGNFASPFVISVPDATGGVIPVTAADINGDGKLDLISGNYLRVASFQKTTAPAVTTLSSPRGFAFDIDQIGFGAGQLIQGTNNAFDGLNRLQVGGTDYAPTSGTATLADGGRTVLLPSQTLAGLTVSRKVTVPNTGGQDFARTIDVLQNTNRQHHRHHRPRCGQSGLRRGDHGIRDFRRHRDRQPQ